MEGQIQMFIYRIEAIVGRVKNVVVELEKLESAHNLTDKQKESPCLLYTSPSPRDRQKSRMPSSA